jgi:hypothetical protein
MMIEEGMMLPATVRLPRQSWVEAPSAAFSAVECRLRHFQDPKLVVEHLQ